MGCNVSTVKEQQFSEAQAVGNNNNQQQQQQHQQSNELNNNNQQAKDQSPGKVKLTINNDSHPGKSVTGKGSAYIVDSTQTTGPTASNTGPATPAAISASAALISSTNTNSPGAVHHKPKIDIELAGAVDGLNGPIAASPTATGTINSSRNVTTTINPNPQLVNTRSATSNAQSGSIQLIDSVPVPVSSMHPRDRFQFTGETLGKGHFAKVKKCRDIITGNYYACKVIERKDMVKSSAIVRAEIEILLAVKQHQNIVSLIDHWEDDRKFYLVMELAEGGDLFSRIVEQGKYSEQQAIQCCKQLASALKYVHDCHVVHRDLKPENILLSSTDPNAALKVADFGLSKLMKEDEHIMKTICGTWAYCGWFI